MLAAAFVLVTATRWLASDARRVYSLSTDEGSQLAIARSLGGRIDWLIAGRAHQPGYGTLLAPIDWLVDEPSTAFRLALAVNAVLGGVMVVLLALIARRVTTASFVSCCACSVAAVVLPGVLLQSAWAAAESLATVLFLATVAASLELGERSSPAWGITTSVAAVLAYTTHSRLGPLVGSVCLLFAIMAARRELRVATAAALIAFTLALTALSMWYSSWIFDTVWVYVTPENSVGATLERLARPVAVFRSALGMSWYQLVTTGGIVSIGVWIVARALVGQPRQSTLGIRRRHAAVLVLHTAPALLVAAVFMASRRLPGHMIHGRYWDGVLGPVIVLGMLGLTVGSLKLVRGATIVGLTSTAGVGVGFWLIQQDALDRAADRAGGLGGDRRILGLLPLLRDGSRVAVLETTAVALVIFVVVAAVTLVAHDRLRMSTSTVVVTGVLGFVVGAASIRTTTIVDRSINGNESASAITTVVDDGTLRPGEPLVIQRPGDKLDSRQLRLWMAYQFYLTRNRIVLGDVGKIDYLADGAAVLLIGDDITTGADSADIIWTDPRRPAAVADRVPGR